MIEELAQVGIDERDLAVVQRDEFLEHGRVVSEVHAVLSREIGGGHAALVRGPVAGIAESGVERLGWLVVVVGVPVMEER